MRALESYVQSPPPGYALLLSGEWGVGKSYSWTHFSDKLRSDGFTVLTISAAGLALMEDLEQALLEVSIEGVGPAALREAGAIVGKALLRLVKVDPKDIKLRAELASGKTVVCIDDLERFSGKFSVLLGFVLNLLDRASVHCVLIADEDRAAEQFKRYRKVKERIVGKTIAVESPRDQFCSLQIKSFSNLRS